MAMIHIAIANYPSTLKSRFFWENFCSTTLQKLGREEIVF